MKINSKTITKVITEYTLNTDDIKKAIKDYIKAYNGNNVDVNNIKITTSLPMGYQNLDIVAFIETISE